MASRLKVFVTSDGFTDYVVATSSRAKALAAWGARQDLFATGGAYETDDAKLAEAACARPGEVLRRPREMRPVKTRLRPQAAAPRRPGPTPAQVRKARDLEAKLTTAAAAYDAELRAIEAERAAIEARRARLESDYLALRHRLREALRQAREALR